MNSLRPRLSPHQWGLVYALMAAITYGVFPASLRAVYNEGGNAVFMVIVSTWARALAMSTTCFVRGVKLFPNRAYTQQSLISGFWQTVSIFGILCALSYIPGPLVVIIVFSHTLMLLFFMAWRREIILDLSNSLSTLCALFGLSLVLDIWHRQPLDHWIGMGGLPSSQQSRVSVGSMSMGTKRKNATQPPSALRTSSSPLASHYPRS